LVQKPQNILSQEKPEIVLIRKKILITVNEKPTISVSENREICLGDTVHLRANNADSYLWTPSTYLNNATISNPIAQPTENITYTVRGTNANGCYEEKTISITS
jgi:hypothetical protein